MGWGKVRKDGRWSLCASGSIHGKTSNTKWLSMDKKHVERSGRGLMQCTALKALKTRHLSVWAETKPRALQKAREVVLLGLSATRV